MKKEIPLTQGQAALVDDWRYEELMQWEWKAWWDPHTKQFYARRAEGKGTERKTILLHRVVANTPKGMICDHINHDTLDCQEHNLRNVTYSQSAMNRNFHLGKNLRERCIHPEGRGYRVLVRKEGKPVLRKNFKTLAEARIARDEAIRKHHGEFLCLTQKTLLPHPKDLPRSPDEAVTIPL